MTGPFIYLIWLALFLGLPILYLCARWPSVLWSRRRALAWTMLGALVGGWLWDGLAIHYHIWYYDPTKIVGIWWLGMPLEEWLWIAGVTFLFGCTAIVLIERTPPQAYASDNVSENDPHS